MFRRNRHFDLKIGVPFSYRSGHLGAVPLPFRTLSLLSCSSLCSLCASNRTPEQPVVRTVTGARQKGCRRQTCRRLIDCKRLAPYPASKRLPGLYQQGSTKGPLELPATIIIAEAHSSTVAPPLGSAIETVANISTVGAGQPLSSIERCGRQYTVYCQYHPQDLAESHHGRPISAADTTSRSILYPRTCTHVSTRSIPAKAAPTAHAIDG